MLWFCEESPLGFFVIHFECVSAAWYGDGDSKLGETFESGTEVISVEYACWGLWLKRVI